MKKWMALALLPLVLSSTSFAKDAADTRQELTQMLLAFLDGAAKGDKAAFEKFFSEDVIYTRGVGKVLDRTTILKDVAPPAPGDPVPSYDAEDIRFHQDGDTAILNFRLVVHGGTKEKPETAFYRNTGTFLRRQNGWRVIAWQATPIAGDNVPASK